MHNTLVLSPRALGLARGARSPAVADLQAYLARYRWLVVGEHATARRGCEDEGGPAAECGRFDGATEAALADFQLFHRVPVTGRLDDATLALMRRPRCALPDQPPALGAVRATAARGSSATAADPAVRRALAGACRAWRSVAAIEPGCVAHHRGSWTRDLPSDGIDTDAAALHIAGHALGLEHSPDPSSVMYAYFGSARRTLSDADIAAVQRLYGAPGR
jgi:hypothetical protein